MMRGRALSVLARVLLILASITGGFLLLQQPARTLEARAAIAILEAFGSHRVYDFGKGSILIDPATAGPFLAVVTPSCSSLASALSLLCLGAVTRTGSVGRRILAVTSAVTVVVVGNIVRITASLAMGLAAGKGSLVLFHDVVGSMFTFLYILAGYILMLFLLLPRSSPQSLAAARV
jgi:carbamoyl-phosphate synthase large subunit